MLLKSKAFAAIIAVLMVILGILIGCARHFNAQAHDLAVLFQSGTEDFVGLDSGLSHIVSRSRNLAAIAEQYYASGEAADSVTALTDAADALSAADTPSAKFDARNTLSGAFDTLYLMMRDDNEVSAEHKRLIETYNSEALTALKESNAEPYNQAAADYNKDYDSFPARFICPLLGIKRAELFS